MTRLERSQLYVPASSRKMIEKAAQSAADAVVIDLEDAVSLDEKVSSRANVIWAFRELDFGLRLKIFRINGLDTPFAYRDLIEVLEAVGDKVALVMMPKAKAARDVHFVETLIEQIEVAQGFSNKIGIEAQIETAHGAMNVREIAASSARLETLIFGSGDFAASAQMPLENIGERGKFDVLYPGDRWHFVMQSIVLAARANGLRCLDGPFAGLQNPEGLEQAARITHALGFDGKQCIHPKQLEAVNTVFSPSEAEVNQAKAVVEALEAAKLEGRGAVSLEGRMIDAANVRMAQAVLFRIEQIEKRQG